MEELVMGEEKKPLDIRQFSDLDEAFLLADSIVTKNYLAELERCEIMSDSQYLDNRDISVYASLFRVKKIVYNRDENNLQKLVNTYASADGFKSNIVMILNSNGKEIELFLGTTGANEVSSARASAKALCNNFIGNFPGSLGDFDSIALDTQPMKNLMNSCTKDLYTCVSCVSGVGSPREKEDVDNENFIQGIEKMIDTMQGIPFSAVFIANYIDRSQMEDIKAEYEVLYSKLVPFLQSNLTFSESSSDGISKTISESLSKTLTKSRSSAMSVGHSESKAHTEGGADTHTDTAGGGVFYGTPGGGVGGHVDYSHSYSRTKSWSDTTTFGTTKTQTNTIGDSEANGEIKSRADGTTLTETSGRSLQITYQNKTVKQLLDKIDEQLERLKESENYGIFATSAYFLAQDSMATKMAASSYKGLINGNCTHVESAHINSWQDSENVRVIKGYIKRLQHPVFRFDENNIVTPASIVSGKELAVQMGMPRKSVPGVSVIETAAFGRNIEMDSSTKHRFIELGNLYHMGRDEEGASGTIPVKLDMESLTMHTFITGSTGAGKSNAIYSILEKVIDSNIPDSNDNTTFLVIEPAKGEYKNKFAYQGVEVYGTNSKKSKLLQINPFSFPDEIHVLEHIDRLVEIFNVCWPMYAAMPAVLKDAIERSYVNVGWNLEESFCVNCDREENYLFPNFLDVLRQINIVMEESAYSSDSKGDYSGALCTRIKSLTNGIYGLIFSGDKIKDADLFDKNVIVDLSRVGSIETKSLIMGLLVMKMQEYRMSKTEGSNNKLKHITVLEEAHNLLKRTSSEQSADSSNLLGKSVEMLANSIAEMRTYGEGFIIADQSPGMLDMSVIRNTNTKIILRLPDISDRELVGRSAALSDNQIIELSKLKTGVAAVYQNNWLEPVLCHIHHCNGDEKLYEYNAPDQERTEGNAQKRQIVDYLMLSAPQKLEVDTNKIKELEKIIYKVHIAGEIKISLLKYIKERDAKTIGAMRNKIVYDLFNSETALLLSNIERYDMQGWREMMISKLSPDISSLEAVYQDKILAIIANEAAERTKTNEAKEMFDNLMQYVKHQEREVK